ncbi:phosphotransferase family enzyme [Paraburkholderia sp. BL6669N2]|uniref:phosphotransferase family protein n=1 Tax=Paraburkholderia sp. BL6669N2 TaxID=1938807 RepID=UPI000E24AD87|nr:aminoglycoside phosphotransferase family protein [Paraburkholderia sp. BL6669N2]REG51031.1 phosphotransferase family enzyme [Paraburkholderia sp. BL6669N2]
MEVALEADSALALLESLRRMRLIRPAEQPVLTPLTGGVSSEIVRVDTSTGVFCVKRALAKLKVAADWSAPLERNAAEVAWMRLAATLVPGCVPSILGEDEEGCAFAMTFLKPADYRLWKGDLMDGVASVETARAVGTTLATIHRATADDGALASEFSTDANFFALRLEPYFLATAAANPDCAEALERLSNDTARTRRALVHGDVSPKNILVGKAGPVFLDAECAWYGDPAFDVAFCLTHLLLKCVLRPDSSAGYLACFDALNDVYFAGASWEDAAALEARAARLLPALLLARVDGKSPVEYLKTEEDRAKVRHFAKRFVVEAPRTLDAIRNRWNKEQA